MAGSRSVSLDVLETHRREINDVEDNAISAEGQMTMARSCEFEEEMYRNNSRRIASDEIQTPSDAPSGEGNFHPTVLRITSISGSVASDTSCKQRI